MSELASGGGVGFPRWRSLSGIKQKVLIQRTVRMVFPQKCRAAELASLPSVSFSLLNPAPLKPSA